MWLFCSHFTVLLPLVYQWQVLIGVTEVGHAYAWLFPISGRKGLILKYVHEHKSSWNSQKGGLFCWGCTPYLKQIMVFFNIPPNLTNFHLVYISFYNHAFVNNLLTKYSDMTCSKQLFCFCLFCVCVLENIKKGVNLQKCIEMQKLFKRWFCFQPFHEKKGLKMAENVLETMRKGVFFYLGIDHVLHLWIGGDTTGADNAFLSLIR